MNQLRAAYVGLCTDAIDLLGRSELGHRWGEDSALPGFPVSSLAGHLARAIFQVGWYLDMPEPDPPTISAVEYYGNLKGADNPSSDLNQGVRARSDETAAGGWARVYVDARKALEQVTDRLEQEPPTRRVPALGRALLIDEYLKTRIVELAIHVDDLSQSLDVPTPELAPEAATTAIAVLVGAARSRHGDRAILNALTRRERDAINALRVL